MKKILVCILAVLLLFTPCAVTVEAANATYYLEDLDVSVQIPEDYAIVWRGIEENDPTLAMMGLSYAELMEGFEERGSYLVSASGIDNVALVITLMPDNLGKQNHFELINYIKDNYTKIEEVLYFDVYMEQK